MEDLGLDGAIAGGWFQQQSADPFILVELDGGFLKLCASELRHAVRRCYIDDELLTSKAAEHGVTHQTIVGARLPDAGATMSGDFGEILTYIYQAAKVHPRKTVGPKKWRLKQDRTKPAPYSDVVHFHLPEWPSASTADFLICSEVKTKATKSLFDPIADAIAHSDKDRTSRLANTLVWLRERALLDKIGNLQLAQLDRFINATDFPPAARYFHAVAVICSSLAQIELATAASKLVPGTSLIVVIVPNLKNTYTAVFEAARVSFA